MLSTQMTQGSKLWKEWKKRNQKISSTEMAAIFYLDKNKSKNQLFSEKRGRKKDFDSLATRHGRYWEAFAIRRFVDLAFDDDWELLRPGCVSDPVEPVCFSPDLMVTHRELDLMYGLEVKCPYSAPIPKRKEDIPVKHVFQAFTCLMVSRADSWFLTFFDSDRGALTSYEISPDWDLWEREILPQVRRFLETIADSSVRDPPFKRKGKAEKEMSDFIRTRLLAVTREREDLSG